MPLPVCAGVAEWLWQLGYEFFHEVVSLLFFLLLVPRIGRVPDRGSVCADS